MIPDSAEIADMTAQVACNAEQHDALVARLAARVATFEAHHGPNDARWPASAYVEAKELRARVADAAEQLHEARTYLSELRPVFPEEG